MADPETSDGQSTGRSDAWSGGQPDGLPPDVVPDAAWRAEWAAVRHYLSGAHTYTAVDGRQFVSPASPAAAAATAAVAAGSSSLQRDRERERKQGGDGWDSERIVRETSGVGVEANASVGVNTKVEESVEAPARVEAVTNARGRGVDVDAKELGCSMLGSPAGAGATGVSHEGGRVEDLGLRVCGFGFWVPYFGFHILGFGINRFGV